jgi:hypothetical protein
MDQISELKRLAGIGNNADDCGGSNISLTGTEKARIQREHNIRPGDEAWFKLWFSLPLWFKESQNPYGDSNGR